MTTVQDIPLDQIIRNQNQPRETFPEDHIRQLAASIKKRGLLQPIIVRPIAGAKKNGPLYSIVAGECRYRAHQAIDAKTIRCIIEAMDDGEMQLRAIVENLQRRDMNPMEEARTFKTLTDTGLNAQQIMEELGLKSTALINQRMTLLDLAPDLQQLVATGNLSVIMAWGVAQAPISHQPRLMREITNGRLRTAEQVKAAGIALREALAQQDAFGDMPRASSQDTAATSRLERKIEDIIAMVRAGFKDGECIAAQRVSPDRVKTMADKLLLIRKHIHQMEHDLRRVATQTELLMEPT